MQTTYTYNNGYLKQIMGKPGKSEYPSFDKYYHDLQESELQLAALASYFWTRSPMEEGTELVEGKDFELQKQHNVNL